MRKTERNLKKLSRQFLELIDEPAWLTDATGRLIGQNERFSKTFGRPSPSSSMEKWFQNFETSPGWDDMWRSIIENGEWTGPLRRTQPDQEESWTACARVVKGEGENDLVVVWRTGRAADDSPHHVAAEELRASRERLKLILDAAPVVLWATDRDGIFTLSEGRELRSIGLAPGEVVGRSLFEMYAGAPDAIRDAKRSLAGESFSEVGTFGPYHYESRHAPLRNHDGEIIGALGVAVNVTERRRAEAELVRVKESLDNAQRIAMLGNWEWILATDVVWWSNEIFRLLGLEMDSVKPGIKPFMRFVHEEERESMQKMIGVALSSDKPWQMEHRLMTAAGQERVVRHWAEVVRDDGGKPLRVRGVIQDITDLRRMEREQEELRAMFVQAQKLESIGRLAGGVAHDFNNLITTVRGYTDLLLRSDDFSDDMRTYIDEIRRAADRAASLSRRLLTFSRREEIHPRVIELDAAVEDAARMIRRLIGENIRLDLRLGGGDGCVHIDPLHLDQVVINLAVNARDAMPRGGRLCVETARVRLDGAAGVAVPHFTPGEYLRLRVTDSGVGVAPEHLDKIFEPFFTTKKEHEGTGLGLATVYGIVTQSKGLIDVTSRLGVGTAFEIHWPVSAHCEVAEPKMEPMRKGRGGRILLVEDEDAVRRLTSLMLRTLGFSVTEAASGLEVLEYSARDASSIDLLMTDVVMPYMNGRELFEKLKPSMPDLRVLYVSGYPLEVVTSYGVVPSDEVFLGKPFTIESLQQKLQGFFSPAPI